MDLRHYFSQTNLQMRRVLRSLARRRERETEVVGRFRAISSVVFESLIEHDGSVFLSSKVPVFGFSPNGHFAHRSHYEQSFNRIELGPDDVADRYRGLELVAHGVAIAGILRLKLLAEYPRRRFQVLVSWDAKPFDLRKRRDGRTSGWLESRRDYERNRRCLVSFWQTRRDEMVLGSLEGYKFQAQGIVTVERESRR